MRIQSTQSGHWTDEQLIEHLYGVGPQDGHLENCLGCLARFSVVEQRGQQLARSIEDSGISESVLAAQRRAIYARLLQPRHWWDELPAKRFAAAAAMVVVLAGGTATLYEKHQRELAESRSDVQLAQEVSQMSVETESPATAPLKGLFVE